MRNGLRAFLVSIRLFAIASVLLHPGCRSEFSDFDSAKYNDRFQAADVPPSHPVSLVELKSLVADSQFGDAIGLETLGYTPADNISFQPFTDGAEGIRRLTMGSSVIEVNGDCATSSITKKTADEQVAYRVMLKGHTHSSGVFGLKRNIVK